MRIHMYLCRGLCVCPSHLHLCELGHVHMYVWHSGPEQSSDSSRTAARWCLPGGADSGPACQSQSMPTSPLFTSSYLVSSKSGWLLFILHVCVLVCVWGGGLHHFLWCVAVIALSCKFQAGIISDEKTEQRLRNQELIHCEETSPSIWFNAIVTELFNIFIKNKIRCDNQCTMHVQKLLQETDFFSDSAQIYHSSYLYSDSQRFFPLGENSRSELNTVNDNCLLLSLIMEAD